MGSIERFLEKRLFIDTAPIIYFIEGKHEFKDRLFKIFEGNEKGKFQLQTSVITLTEVLVRPLKLGRKDLARQYESILLNSPFFDIYQIDIVSAITAAELRATHNIKTPDALQIATALNHGADFFLTNDKALKSVNEIEVLLPQDLV